MNVRRRIFNALTRWAKHPEGRMLTRPFKLLHWLLFPLDTFYWHVLMAPSYVQHDVMRQTVRVGDKVYSIALLEMGFKPGVYTVRIVKESNTYTLEEVKQ